MKRISTKRLCVALLSTGLLGAFAFAGPAAAEQERGAPQPTITAKYNTNGKPVFRGPASVARGDELRIVNGTNPDADGPHTFTLVRKRWLPTRRSCAICGKVAKAHKVTRNGTVKKPIVESGRVGWDRMFSRKVRGDSWYTETTDEEHTRTVSAKAGKVLHFFCAVHPFMKGQIKVVPPPIHD